VTAAWSRISAERNSWQASIYVDTTLSASEIAARLAHALHGSVTSAGATTVTAERIDLDVTQYDQRPPSEPQDDEDVFLYFPYDIEVFAGEPCDPKALVADVSTVLRVLHQLDARYVTAADFEDELPCSGRSRPWPEAL
jgi:hypothetical protein